MTSIANIRKKTHLQEIPDDYTLPPNIGTLLSMMYRFSCAPIKPDDPPPPTVTLKLHNTYPELKVGDVTTFYVRIFSPHK